MGEVQVKRRVRAFKNNIPFFVLLLANFQRLFALTRGRCLYDPFVKIKRVY